MERILEVPCPEFKLQLSNWDERFMPLYSKRILCFSLHRKIEDDYEKIVQLLFKALQSTVDELPFLAGSIVRHSKTSPWLYDIRSQGAAYLEIKDYTREMSFLNLRKAQFPSALLDSQKLCPLPRPTYNRDEDFPAAVCRLRANFVDGGLLLVVSIAHTICDGRAISDVLEMFSGKLREAQVDETLRQSKGSGDTIRPYNFDRTSVITGNGSPGAIGNHPWMTEQPVNAQLRLGECTKTICMNFHVSKESLSILKEAASPPPLSSSTVADLNDFSHEPNGHPEHTSPQVPYISTLDAVMALIWRSIMLARHRVGLIPDDRLTNCVCPVDMRSRLQLQDPYFGNAISGHKASLTVSTLAPETTTPHTPSTAAQFSGLQAAAALIRNGIIGCTVDKFRDLINYTSRVNKHKHLRLSVAEDLTIGSILLTSYYGFAMHELDFGPAFGEDGGGKIEAFRLPSQGLLPGMPVVLPKLRDGSCEFVINEREDVMERLKGDELFWRFVSRQAAVEMVVNGVT